MKIWWYGGYNKAGEEMRKITKFSMKRKKKILIEKRVLRKQLLKRKAVSIGTLLPYIIINMVA
jgi:hypothetical protein